jgi:hypothetical protein
MLEEVHNQKSFTQQLATVRQMNLRRQGLPVALILPQPGFSYILAKGFCSGVLAVFDAFLQNP